jgi:hypothetical protein
VPERFPTLLYQTGRTENAPDHCLGEHLYPTGDPAWSIDALEDMRLNDIGVSSPFIDSETIDEMSLAQGAVPVMLAPYLPIAVCAFVPGVANLLYRRRLCCYRHCEAGLLGRARSWGTPSSPLANPPRFYYAFSCWRCILRRLPLQTG